MKPVLNGSSKWDLDFPRLRVVGELSLYTILPLIMFQLLDAGLPEPVPYVAGNLASEEVQKALVKKDRTTEFAYYRQSLVDIGGLGVAHHLP